MPIRHHVHLCVQGVLVFCSADLTSGLVCSARRVSFSLTGNRQADHSGTGQLSQADRSRFSLSDRSDGFCLDWEGSRFPVDRCERLMDESRVLIVLTLISRRAESW
jgi:hypothetical protein